MWDAVWKVLQPQPLQNGMVCTLTSPRLSANNSSSAESHAVSLQQIGFWKLISYIQRTNWICWRFVINLPVKVGHSPLITRVRAFSLELRFAPWLMQTPFLTAFLVHPFSLHCFFLEPCCTHTPAFLALFKHCGKEHFLFHGFSFASFMRADRIHHD